MDAMSDPLTDIENQKAQQDLGVTGYRVFVGARTEGASLWEAVLMAYAFFRAISHGEPEAEDS